MKKLVFILTLIMAVMVVNAQVTRVAVKTGDLPKGITDNVAKNYMGFNIKDATRVTENNIVTYDVVLTKGTDMETLVYDKDGKFLRKALPTAQPMAHTNHKHEEKTPPAKK
jgi:hypothetical protein